MMMWEDDAPGDESPGMEALDPCERPSVRRCALRHMAVAADGLARDSGRSRASARRLALLVSRLHELASNPLGDRRGEPKVALVRGEISLVDLLIDAWGQQHRWYNGSSSLNPALVEGACELLEGLAWRYEARTPETAEDRARRGEAAFPKQSDRPIPPGILTARPTLF